MCAAARRDFFVLAPAPGAGSRGHDFSWLVKWNMLINRRARWRTVYADQAPAAGLDGVGIGQPASPERCCDAARDSVRPDLRDAC